MRADAVAGALRRRAPWVALPLGALQSLAFAPLALWPIAPMALALLWWLWDGEAPRRAAKTGFAFGAGLFLAGTYWLYTCVHGFGKAPAALALFLMLGLVSIMGCYSAALGWVVTRFTVSGPLRSLAVLPAGWVLMEWFRGWFLSGFPWLAAGYSALDTPLAGYAPVAGIYGVSLCVCVTAGAALVALESRRPGRVVALGVAVAALWLGGSALRTVEWTRPSAPALSVALVQGAISQDQKWLEDNREHTKDVYRQLTEQALGARIVVWPESALPFLYHEAVPYLATLYNEARGRGSDLVFGLIRYDFDSDQYRNGIVALGAEEEWYYKRRLVPFGEFFPVPPMVRTWMRLQSLAYVDFNPGAPDQGPLDAGGQKLGATICYEDAYAVEQLRVLKDATLLVNVSNDAWFGDSTAPHQHLQIARMRALEAGRWLLRATNNGISALIDPHGRVVVRSRQFVPEVVRGEVVPYTGLTPYARLRNWPVLVLCALGVVAGGLSRLRGGRPLSQA